VTGHERCQWPEGQVTCRLLDAGIRLEPLRGVSFRIVAHTKLNKGNHPPQTGPRSLPHVCAGKAAVLPPNMDDWTKEDVIVWVRQEVGLGGVAAALAGASPGRCVRCARQLESSPHATQAELQLLTLWRLGVLGV
jgi:uncharacterized Zn-binding protein involved in type VI secretion